MEFGLLGPVEVVEQGTRLSVGGPRQLKALATLLLEAGRAVSIDRLIRALWDDPPATARQQVHNCIAALRQSLAATSHASGFLADSDSIAIVRSGRGYAAIVQPTQVDAYRFDALVDKAHSLADDGDLRQASDILRDAQALWRGQALGGLRGAYIEAEAHHLEEKRVACIERRIDCDLMLGRHQDLVGELATLVAEHPTRERLIEVLMLALYRSGRRRDALEAYTAARKRLTDELGLDPPTSMQALQQAILRDDPMLREPATVWREADWGGSSRPTVVHSGTRLSAPSQLPADVPDFIGRATELRTLTAIGEDARNADSPTIVVITGTAGVGKTALAVHWAHSMANAFPGGQLFVDLRGYDAGQPQPPAQVLASFLRGFDVDPARIPAEVEQAAALFRTAVSGRRVLVLLDNARSVEQVRPLLPGAAGSLVLITSRDRLSGLIAREGARRFTLDVFDPDEAVGLLARIIGRSRVRADPEGAARLAVRCGHLALALRIAAANLADHPTLGIGQYADGLADGPIAELRIEGDDPTAVEVAFDQSYATLTPAAQLLFRLLGTAPGRDISAGAAAALAGGEQRHVPRLLDQLAGAHLISQASTGGFALHDLLRHYAWQRALAHDQPDELAAALARLDSYYLHSVDAAARLLYPEKLRLPLPPRAEGVAPAQFPDHHQAREWLDRELPNLVACIVTADEHRLDTAWLLADALRGYLWLRMRTVEWLTVAQAALDASMRSGAIAASALAHLSIADAHVLMSNYAPAEAAYLRAHAIFRQIGWADGQSAALGNLGNIYWRSGRLDRAAEIYQEALVIDRRTGWIAGQAIKLSNLASVYHALGRLRVAADYHTQALALDGEGGLDGTAACDLGGLGQVYLDLGMLDKAMDCVEQALALHRAVGDRPNEADTLRIKAAILSTAGQPTQALATATAALAMASDAGDRRVEADSFDTLGQAYLQLGNFGTAAELHKRAILLAQEGDSRYSEAKATIGLSQALAHTGEAGDAFDHATHAVALARESGFRVLEGEALDVLAELHALAGDQSQARTCADQALAIYRETGHWRGSPGTRPSLECTTDGAASSRHGIESEATLDVGGAARRREAADDGWTDRAVK